MNYAIRSKMMSLAAGGLLAAMLPAGFAWADCVKAGDDPSVFSLLIDATSSCQNMSPNMVGCMADASGTCTIIKGNQSITVQASPGAVGGSQPFNWSVSGWSQNLTNPNARTVDFVISLGATSGGTCGWSYSPGSSFGKGLAFLKSNGSYQKVGGIYFCSDLQAPLPADPRLSLKKTVMPKDGTCGIDDVDLLDAKTGQQVVYCYVVENLGNGAANNLVLVDDNATPGDMSDDFTTMDGGGITLKGLSGGELAPGGTATGNSPVVTLTKAGKLVNTATIDGDSVNNPGNDVAAASDTATVNVSQSLVTCPADFQKAVNQLVTETDDFTFAVLHNPKKPEDVSVCVPTNEDPSSVRVRGVSCIDECILKPGCDQTPLPAGCAPQVCQESGAWTTHDEITGACVKVTDRGDKVPYCWEVEQDLNQDCELNATQPMKTHEVITREIHSNPYVYQSCTKSGGRTVCTTYCYLYPGETSSVCPSGSIIK